MLAVFLGALVMAYFLFANYSSGSRAGTIIKLSKKGVVFKTWEGELNMAMYVGDLSAASAVSHLWEFSVHRSDTAVIRRINDAMLSGQRVRLDYEEKYVAFPWYGDTKYYVTSVEVLDK